MTETALCGTRKERKKDKEGKKAEEQDVQPR